MYFTILNLKYFMSHSITDEMFFTEILGKHISREPLIKETTVEKL